MISISSRMLLYLSLFMRSPCLTVIYTEKTWSNVTWHLNNFSDHTFKATERCFLRQPDQCGKEREEIKLPRFCFDQLCLWKGVDFESGHSTGKKIKGQFSICINYGHCSVELRCGLQTEVWLKGKRDVRGRTETLCLVLSKIPQELPPSSLAWAAMP